MGICVTVYMIFGGCIIRKRGYMKVNVEREIDINRLITNLNEKSQCKDPGMAGYEVTVSKQLLRDAHDVIKQFMNKENVVPKYKVGQVFRIKDKAYLSERRYMELDGFYQITEVENNNEIRYHIKNLKSRDVFAVKESLLNNNELITGQVTILG